MAMAWEQWTEIVARLNASWPDQQIEAPTAREWFDDLRHLNPGDVWLAIRELRKEQRWRPSMAEILAGVKLYRAELAYQLASQDRLRALGRQGVPMPPETKQVMLILGESIKGTIDKAEARQMIDALADRLKARIGPGWEAAS